MRKRLLILASFFSLGLVACGPVQSPECARFLECQRAIDEEQGTSTVDQYEEDYGENGACWNENVQFAQNCTKACIDALEAAETNFANVAACQPESEEG